MLPSQFLRRGATSVLLLFIAAVPAAAQRTQIEAVPGTPFGVGRIILPRTYEPPGNPWADGRMDISDAQGRLMYPVYVDGPIRQLIRDTVGINGQVMIHFLFQGTEPLDVTVRAPDPVTFHIVPGARRRNDYPRLLNAWWRAYTRAAELRTRGSGYPPMVDAYLTSTLARRLRLQPPKLGPGGLLHFELDEGIEMLLGTEALELRTQVRSLLGTNGAGGQGRRPLPAEPQWTPLDYPPIPDDVKTEPIATQVPEDCFYLRCGTYANYVWMQTLTEEWGGELRNMISQRGVDYGINPRTERRLALRDNALSRALGGTVISDVAIIGADPFFREGAAMGMLFEARSSLLLAQSLSKQRAEAIAREEGRAVEKTVEVAGQKVSFISTPDGAVRSFYAVRGSYHFVTTSRSLAQDFLTLGKEGGKKPLSGSTGFHYARSLMPVARQDTLFLYLPEGFFRRLASPRYRIEMARRTRSITDMQSLPLARFSSAAEGKPAHTIDDLIAADFLPPGFGQRSDGSQMVIRDGRMADSVRGFLGSFVPIPDMEIDRVSVSEANEYFDFARAYQAAPSRMDPLIVGVRRAATETEGVEQISIDVRVAPLSTEQYQRISQYLGPARAQRLAKLPGDLVRIDGVGPRGNYLFLGVQDFEPALVVRNGRIRWALESYDRVRAYLGGSPSLGEVENWLGLLLGGQAVPDAQGYVRWPFGLWQRSTGNMTLLSFQRDLLEWVTPQLQFQPTKPAQVHVDVEDLSQTGLASAVNAFGYNQTRKVSFNNCALLKLLQRQLRVPPERCLAIAEELSGGRLTCSLGGQYEMAASDDGRVSWVSSAWSGKNAAALTEIPKDYVFPVLAWLRGLNLRLSVEPKMLTLTANALAQRQAGGGIAWPSLPKAAPPKATPPKVALPKVALPGETPPAPTLPKVTFPPPEAPQETPPGSEELPPPTPTPPTRRDPFD